MLTCLLTFCAGAVVALVGRVALNVWIARRKGYDV